MSRISYISAANCDRKHLENSKIGLENYCFFSSKGVGTLACQLLTIAVFMHTSLCCFKDLLLLVMIDEVCVLCLL